MTALAAAPRAVGPLVSIDGVLLNTLRHEHAAALQLASAAARMPVGRTYADAVQRAAAIHSNLRQAGHADEAARLEQVAQAHLAPLAFQSGAVA